MCIILVTLTIHRYEEGECYRSARNAAALWRILLGAPCRIVRYYYTKPKNQDSQTPGTKTLTSTSWAQRPQKHKINMEASEDLESNLRLFAMRKAAAASKEFSDLKSRVVVSVQSGPNRHCPMHGKHGNYQAPSRKEMAKELRLYAREARERSFEHQSRRMASRSQSLEPNNCDLFGSNSMTLPRRFSSASPLVASTTSSVTSKINRHGSFQDQPPPAKKDMFTPKVDFKTTLRQFNPKDDERSRGLISMTSNNSSRPSNDGELMDYHDSNSYFTQQLTLHNPYSVNPRRGTILSDSSGPASLPIMSSRPKSRLKLDLSSSSSRPTTPLSLKSPTSSRPQSPRRVEFADEVFFNFNGHHMYQRSASTDLNSIVKKPILRHVHSEALPVSAKACALASERPASAASNKRPLSLIEQFHSQNNGNNNKHDEPLTPLVIEHTNLDTSSAASTKNNAISAGIIAHNSADLANQRKISQNDDSLVQIYIPPSSSKDTTESESETLSAGNSDNELFDEDEEVNEVKKSEVRRTLSAEVASRKVPPKLSDWNRSQSFPPPKNGSTNEAVNTDFNGLHKTNALTDSEASLPTKECNYIVFKQWFSNFFGIVTHF